MDPLLMVAGADMRLLFDLAGMEAEAQMTPQLLLVCGVASMVAVGNDLWLAVTSKRGGSRA